MQLRREFQLYERDIRIQNYRLCSGLASFFMLAGASLDFIVYRLAGMIQFLPFRIMSVVTLLGISFLLGTKWAREWHRTLGICMSVPLMGSIGWMIYASEGYASPYYAGLNLVMLGAAILMRWPLFESVLIVLLTVGIYFAACYFHGPILDLRLFFNNSYFLFVTGVFTVAGTWFYNNIRFSEFLLRQSLDAKHEELGQAVKQLEENNQKLRELDVAKNRFFANISHELRTPLTLLIAPVETLLNKGAAIAETERQAMLSTMQANAMRLLKLINTLLELVWLDSQTSELKKAPVVMADFVGELSNACQALARDKHIKLNATAAADIPALMADAEKLERVCLNLLFNALKFTPAGGTITFSASYDGINICLQVSDTGVGISADHLPHLFSRFWQADASSQRRFQGLGIGLALVKEIVDLHKGSINVESVLGKGTTFTILLPYERANSNQVESSELEKRQEPQTEEWIVDLYRRAEFSPSSAEAPRRTERNVLPKQTFRRGTAGKATLLIAEDEPDMMAYLSGQLSADFEIIKAEDGNEAVSMANQYLPDIILSDLMMPYKNGMQVCRELRAHTSTRSIPVVLLTARPDERSKIEALTAGATDFIGKPFSLTEVRVRLTNLAESHRYQRKLAEQKNQLQATLEQLKETESLLVQHEKLSALGRMSAGLIHEINNPLNFATQGIYWLKQMSDRVPDTLKNDFIETLEDVDVGVKRVVTIIADLRSFTRPNQDSFADFEVHTMVNTVLRFFSHHQKDGIRFLVNVPEGVLIHGNHGHMTQVLVNLLQNSIDATAEKNYSKNEAPTIEIQVSQKLERVIISVKDNGTGMSGETQENVFDPFFTTKEVGKGLGLGLSICHRILADHQGIVTINSKEGVGTEFILDLPEASSYRTSTQETTFV